MPTPASLPSFADGDGMKRLDFRMRMWQPAERLVEIRNGRCYLPLIINGGGPRISTSWLIRGDW